MSENGDNAIASVLRSMYRNADGSFTLSGLFSKITTIGFVGMFLSKLGGGKVDTESVLAASGNSVGSHTLSQGYSELKGKVNQMVEAGVTNNDNPAKEFLLGESKKQKDAGINGEVFTVTSILEKHTNGAVTANTLGNPKTLQEYSAAIANAGFARENNSKTFKAGEQFIAKVSGVDRLVSVDSFDAEKGTAKLTFIDNLKVHWSGAKAPYPQQEVEFNVTTGKKGEITLVSKDGKTKITPQGKILNLDGFIENKAPEYHSSEKEKLNISKDKSSSITAAETLSDISKLPLGDIKKATDNKADIAVVSRPTDTPELNNFISLKGASNGGGRYNG
jgi:hypothetical protein